MTILHYCDYCPLRIAARHWSVGVNLLRLTAAPPNLLRLQAPLADQPTPPPFPALSYSIHSIIQLLYYKPPKPRSSRLPPRPHAYPSPFLAFHAPLTPLITSPYLSEVRTVSCTPLYGEGSVDGPLLLVVKLLALVRYCSLVLPRARLAISLSFFSLRLCAFPLILPVLRRAPAFHDFHAFHSSSSLTSDPACLGRSASSPI